MRALSLPSFLVSGLILFQALAFDAAAQVGYRTYEDAKGSLETAKLSITLRDHYTQKQIENLSLVTAQKMKKSFEDYFFVLRGIAFSDRLDNEQKAELLADGMTKLSLEFIILTEPYPDPVRGVQPWNSYSMTGNRAGNIFMGTLDRLRYFLQVLGRDMYRYVNFFYLDQNSRRPGLGSIRMRFSDAFPLFGRGSRRTSVVNRIGFESIRMYELGLKEQKGKTIESDEIRLRTWYQKLFTWSLSKFPLNVVGWLGNKTTNFNKKKEDKEALAALQDQNEIGSVRSMGLLASIFQMHRMEGAEPLKYGARHLWATWIERTFGVLWFIHPTPELAFYLSDWSPLISGTIYLALGWYLLPRSRKVTSGLDFYKKVLRVRKVTHEYFTKGDCERRLGV